MTKPKEAQEATHPSIDSSSVAPIDYSVPYRTRTRGADRHFGFFPFFAKKPWPVVQEYIRHYSSRGDTVLDPFSGTGVTPVEALVLRRRTIASDINPLSRFITEMTALSPVDISKLREAFDLVRADAAKEVQAIDSTSPSEAASWAVPPGAPSSPIPSSVRRKGADRVYELHTSRQLHGLLRLREAINKLDDPTYRDLLRVVFGRTVRYCNRTYQVPQGRSLYRGDSMIFRRFSYSFASEAGFAELPVWATFEKMVTGVIRAKEETNRLIGDFYSEGFTFSPTSASEIHTVTGEATVDYCFTDPPYANDIYFLDLSVLWIDWLQLPFSRANQEAELIIGGALGKTQEAFGMMFAQTMESIARTLKPGAWMTLVYKHRDLGLWQMVVNACEEAGLRYVNSIWQDIKIRSTRQAESPGTNPSGDMYLNFRRISKAQFAAQYNPSRVTDLPTPANYIERETERVIVMYLGATIELITGCVIQQLLDSRAFQHVNPDGLGNKIVECLHSSPRFVRWDTQGKDAPWVLSSDFHPDASLPIYDRLRYEIFAFLRQADGAVTEAGISRYLLSVFSAEPPEEQIRSSGLALYLSQMANQVGLHQWQLDAERITSYKQLRLFLERSRADEILQAMAKRGTTSDSSLRVRFEGIALLLETLKQANSDNRHFHDQWKWMLDILRAVLQRIMSHFGSEIDSVWASGDWVVEGVDLRNLPFEETVLDIVLAGQERPFSLYREFSERCFMSTELGEAPFQFRLLTKSEWEHGDSDRHGICLLDRA